MKRFCINQNINEADSVRSKRIINCIFASILFLYIGFNIVFLDTNKEVSMQERRNLCKAESLELLFFKPFLINNYIKDHLAFRKDVIRFYTRNTCKTSGEMANVIVGKNGWLFNAVKGNSVLYGSTEIYQNLIEFSGQEKAKIKSDFEKISDWCKAHNIKVYVMFPEEAMRYYKEHYPDYIIQRTNKRLIDQAIELMPKDMKIIRLEKALLKAKQNLTRPIYYKHENHWTYDGAFVAYQELMRAIKKDYNFINPLTTKDYNITLTDRIFCRYAEKIQLADGNLCSNLFIQEEYREKIYGHYELRNHQKVHLLVHNYKTETSKREDGQNLNVYMIGDSYGRFFSKFLCDTFKNVKMVRINPPRFRQGIFFFSRTEDILKHKTNVLIIQLLDIKLILLKKAL